MFRKLLLVAASVATIAVYTAASAKTFNIVGSYVGEDLGNVRFDITIDGDFTANINGAAARLTVNSLTASLFPGEDPFLISGGIGYSYNQPFDFLEIRGGGGLSDYPGSYNFVLQILGFINPPITDVDVADYFSPETEGRPPFAQLVSLTITEIVPVPLPAGALLLLTGVAGLPALRRRKKHVT